VSKRLWAIAGLVVVSLLGVGLATAGFRARQASGHPTAAPPSPEPSAPPVQTSAPPATTPPATTRPAATYPQVGSKAWTVAPGETAIVGRGARLLRFQVAVERDIANFDVAEFAAEVFTTLSDERSWIGLGNVRFQRVGPGQTPDFTVYLATPATRDILCQAVYDRYTSCRRDNKVVLNVARWLTGVPNYGADLSVYRQYMVNHEVGHRVGHGHELCPGPGKPAPVMQQQTLGMHGCVANPWVMLDGKRYAGRSGQYDDHPPRV
jgi:hypothetical protein